jgi:hypothetical protein
MTVNQLAITDKDVAAVQLRVNELRRWMQSATPRDLAKIANQASDARKWLRVKAAATTMRVEASRLECEALRRLGMINGGVDLLSDSPSKTTARKFADMDEGSWEEFLSSITDGAAPLTLHKRFQGEQKKDAAAKYTAGEIDRVKKEYMQSGEPFTIDDFREKILVRWASDGVSANSDPGWMRKSRKQAGIALDDLVWDDPYVREGMNEVIRSALRGMLGSYDLDTARLPEFIAYLDTSKRWIHVHVDTASPEQLRFAALWRRQQAAALIKVAEDIEIEADSKDESTSSDGVSYSQDMSHYPAIQQYRDDIDRALHVLHQAVSKYRNDESASAGVFMADQLIAHITWPIRIDLSTISYEDILDLSEYRNPLDDQ